MDAANNVAVQRIRARPLSILEHREREFRCNRWFKKAAARRSFLVTSTDGE